MSAETLALHNGAPPGAALAHSRALHYGDGVFRTVLRHGGDFVDWEAQLAKLAQDAAALGLAAPATGLLDAEARMLFGPQAEGVLKILLWRAGSHRGYRSETPASERLLLRYLLPDFDAACWTRGIRAFIAEQRLASQPQLAGIKHLNRLEQVLASREWPAEAQEGVVLSASGAPLGGTRSNLFWVQRGQLCTPDLSEGGVAGLTRDRVLEAAHACGLRIAIAAFALTELMESEEAFFTNSLFGLWPLRELGERRWATPGAHTRALMQRLAHPLVQDSPK